MLIKKVLALYIILYYIINNMLNAVFKGIIYITIFVIL